MNAETLKRLRAAEQAVKRLVEECRQGGRLYPQNPRAVAQVSRTGKWLLNALATLHRELDTPGTEGAQAS